MPVPWAYPGRQRGTREEPGGARDGRAGSPGTSFSSGTRSGTCRKERGGTPVAYDQEALDLVLLRHGQSTWNAQNLFTGWVDVDLTELGEGEARDGGRLLAEEPGLDLRILHTSVLTRAIRTAEIALAAAGRSWLPVRRDWRLNERHYGDLQGKNKAEILAEFGKEQLLLWRRSYDTPPPPISADNPWSSGDDPRYRDLAPSDIPLT